MKIETLEEVIRIIESAKLAGLASLELDCLKIKFAKHAAHMKPKPEMNRIVPDVKAEELVKSHAFLDDLTAEEILYYATPHFDEIQADKEHKKQLMTDEAV